MLRRGKFIPPKACGHGGVCDAAVSCGIFYSVVTKTEPLSEVSWGDIHIINGKCLIKVGEVGGPRCCNRDANLSIIETVRFVKEKLGVEMELHDIAARILRTTSSTSARGVLSTQREEMDSSADSGYITIYI